MKAVVYEDVLVNNFNPLTKIKPFPFLFNGCMTIKERIERVFYDYQISFAVRENLTDLLEEKYQLKNFKKDDIKTLFLNSRIKHPELLKEVLSSNLQEEFILKNEDTIIAAYVSGLKYEYLVNNNLKGFSVKIISTSELETYNYPWDLVLDNESKIKSDISLLKDNLKATTKEPENVVLNRKENIFLGDNVIIKAGVIIDAEEGPVYIDDEAKIMHNSVIIGPCYIGKKSTIKISSKIYENCSIGSVCKVGGELEGSIISGYSNKQHDGFLGHAYIGEWCNFGADTNNSDLKNNYSDVSVEINGKIINTGSMFVGLFMGDHSKTGINTMFNTGTVVGIGCNVFGEGFPPRNIPDQYWGGKSKLIKYPTCRIVKTAKVVMKRRNVEMTRAEEELFFAILNTKN